MQLKATTLAILFLALLNGASASKPDFLKELAKKQAERATKTIGEKPVTAPSTVTGTTVTPTAPVPKVVKPPSGATPIVPFPTQTPPASASGGGGGGSVAHLAKTLSIPVLGPRLVGGRLETPQQARERMASTTTTTPQATKPTEPSKTLPTKPSVVPRPSISGTPAPSKPVAEPKKEVPTLPAKTPTKTVTPPKTSVAGSPEAQQFEKALSANDWEAMRSIYEKGSDDLKKHYAGKLIELGPSVLASMGREARQLSYKGELWGWATSVLSQYATAKVVEEFEGRLTNLNYDIFVMAKDIDVVCNTGKFLSLLKHLTRQFDQEAFIGDGIDTMIRKRRFDCINALRFAIKKDGLLNPKLNDTAIYYAFLNGVTSGGEGLSYAKQLIYDPGFHEGLYVMLLFYINGEEGPDGKTFRWLLERADRQDLGGVRDAPAFSTQSSEFQAAINKAWELAGTKTRRVGGRGGISAARSKFEPPR